MRRHAREHLGALAKILYGPGTPKAKAWAALRVVDLDAGAVEKLISTMTRLRPAPRPNATHCAGASPTSRPTHLECAAPPFAATASFVGSGVIEAGCKTIAGRRLKQSGIR